MKKVKVMLWAVTVMAVVAATLAFKAKYSNEVFCVAEPAWYPLGPTCVDPNGDVLWCQDLTEGYTTEWPYGTTWCYREPHPLWWCDFTNCPALTFIADE